MGRFCCSITIDCVFVCIVRVRKCILLSVAVTFLCATLLLVGGIYITFTYQAPASSSNTILGHRNDTILLDGGIDSFSYSNVTVRQCISGGDDYHSAIVYAMKSKDVALKRELTLFQFQRHYQDSPSYKSGIQDYLYLLPNSSFTYRVCLSSSTPRDQRVMYLLFDNAISYGSYVDDQENGESYSIFNKALIAKRNNQPTCTDISYDIAHPSYYFMMMRLPGNVSYSYNFTLQKVSYDTTNANESCRISNSNDCELSLTGNNFKHVDYDILAYIQPGYMESSIVTHLCISTHGGSTTLMKFSYISGSFLGVGGVLLGVSTTIVLIAVLLQMCRNYKVSEERQKLLNHY